MCIKNFIHAVKLDIEVNIVVKSEGFYLAVTFDCSGYEETSENYGDFS
jgi:hypothetical protein